MGLKKLVGILKCSRSCPGFIVFLYAANNETLRNSSLYKTNNSSCEQKNVLIIIFCWLPGPPLPRAGVLYSACYGLLYAGMLSNPTYLLCAVCARQCCARLSAGLQ